MADLDSGNTGYPAALDAVGTEETTSQVTDHLRANSNSKAIVAIETELGIDPAGNKTDVVTRLLAAMDGDGLLKLSDVIQMVYSTDNAVSAALTTNIPLDDTIPQNTEGDEVLTQAVTPKSATSILEIIAQVHVSAAAAAHITAALFVDSTADAIAAASERVETGDMIVPLTVRHLVVSGSLTARTYKVRVGTNSQDVVLNGIVTGPARRFGGVLISSIRVAEWQV